MNQGPGNTIGDVDIILIHRHTHSLNVPLSLIFPFIPLLFTASFSPYQCTISSLLWLSLPSPISPSDVSPEAMYPPYYCASFLSSLLHHTPGL